MVRRQGEDLAGTIRLLVQPAWERHTETADRSIQCLVGGSREELDNYHKGHWHAAYILVIVCLTLPPTPAATDEGRRRIDDVEDSSILRRGVPVAHSIFGTAQTINSANYVYFCALQELVKLNNQKAIQIYTEELCNLHRGQGMDLFWRDTLTCPTEDDYLEMVSNKTGGLFRLAVKLMQAESTSTKYVPSLPPSPATPN